MSEVQDGPGVLSDSYELFKFEVSHHNVDEKCRSFILVRVTSGGTVPEDIQLHRRRLIMRTVNLP